ncbi:P-loop NTPase fold protein [Dokdonella sp.]|uniref:KAP family P-loop NTPase fold protein n=1 Tax=Dokdonella sp. TaxID=2291710 RepID=UPI003527F864
MKFKSQPIEIPNEDPFRNDVLDRRPAVEFLTDLVLKIDPPFVLCIDSPWGTGKTTFLRMWERYLSDRQVETLYFNAWETDFAEDPLLAFVSEICEFTESRLAERSSPNAKKLDRAKHIASAIARRVLPVAGKLATAGLLDLDSFTESALAELTEESIKNATDAYLAEKNLIRKFHDSLESLVKTLPKQDGQPMLLILVDELDRCRPNYAVELLERIKHLLNVKNVMFVLALDKSQTQVSLSTIYGREFEATEYLRRFIDLEFRLPEPNVEKFTKHLLNELGLEECFSQRTHSEFRFDKEQLEDVFNGLSRLFGFSLRAREQCFTRIRMAILSVPDNHYLHPMLLVTLVVLRTVATDVYRKFMSNSGGASDVINFFRSQEGGVTFLNSHSGRVVEAYLIGVKRGHRESSPEYLEHQRISSDDGAAEEERERASFILGVLGEFRFRDRLPRLEAIASTIELSGRIER